MSETFSLYTTPEGELNLRDEKGSLHAEKGAALEAEKWAAIVMESMAQIVVVYGVGLGYFYDPLQEWLKRGENRYLVFLEDNPNVREHFLHTERAAQMLQDPHVFLLPFERPKNREWTSLGEKIDKFLWAFVGRQVFVTALPAYAARYPAFFEKLKGQTYYWLKERRIELIEFEPGYHKMVFENFYQNLPHIAESYDFSKMTGKFEKIPAIICGAGPSLDKQLSLLKELGKDKALIFGAGTSVNILTAQGIYPHFAAGLDPNDISGERMRTSSAFETPYFYSNRYYHGALDLVTGKKIFLPVAIPFYVSEWWLEQLGIESEWASFATSTPSLCAGVANALGCDPIITIGMDLAYTESKRYSAGVGLHPLDLPKVEGSLGEHTEETVDALGYQGQKVKTRFGWLNESYGLGIIAAKDNEATWIDATEGGLTFPHFQEMPFQEVVRKHLRRSFPLAEKIETALQPLNVSPQKLQETLTLWRQSLERCKEKEGQEEEIAYRFLLKQLKEIFLIAHALFLLPYRYHPELFSKEEIEQKENELEEKVEHYVQQAINFHLEQCPETVKKVKTPPPKLHYNEEGVLDGEQQFFHPNCALKRTLMFSNGQLNGKEAWFYEDGKPYMEAFYSHNHPIGRAKMWHKNGQLAKEVIFYDSPRNYDVFEWDEQGNVTTKKLFMPEDPFEKIKQKNKELKEKIDHLKSQLENE